MMISFGNLNLRIKLELWRFMGFGSSIVGLICYSLSSSFKYLIGDWNPFKLFLYGMLVFVICGTILFAKQWPLSLRGKLKAHLGFAVLMLTSVYSFFYDKAMNGKPDLPSMVSNGAFALMSLSFSRVFMLGFEVGLFAFFLGCLAVQLMKINLMLISVAVAYGYPLFLIHSSSDSSPDKVDEPLGSDDPYYTRGYTRAMDVLTTLTADKPVVIFSKSTCCMSHTVRALIFSFGANPVVIEIDKLPNGQQVERALLQLGCRPTVPAVFIGQQFIGGTDEVISLNVQNKLAQLLLRARAIFIWNR